VRVDDAKPFANSVLLEGDATIGGRRFVRADRKLEGAGFPAIPTRRQEIWNDGPSIPILRNLTAETTMFPLRFWARPNGTDAPVEDANGEPLGSFLSFDAPPVRGTGFWRRAVSWVASIPRIFARGAVYLTLTGDGTNVVAGGTTTVYQRTIATIQPGQSRHFALPPRLRRSDPRRRRAQRGAGAAVVPRDVQRPAPAARLRHAGQLPALIRERRLAAGATKRKERDLPHHA